MLDIVRDAMEKEKVTGGLALHSDQGFQYTSREYFKLTQSLNHTTFLRQYQDAETHMTMPWRKIFSQSSRTECIHRIRLRTFKEANRVIDGYIQFYNFQLIRLKTKLTPVEFRCQFVV